MRLFGYYSETVKFRIRMAMKTQLTAMIDQNTILERTTAENKVLGSLDMLLFILLLVTFGTCQSAKCKCSLLALNKKKFKVTNNSFISTQWRKNSNH